MTGPRYWWQEPVEEDGEVVVAASSTHHASHGPSSPQGGGTKADPARLKQYREALRGRALLQPRGSVRRREIEKRLCKVTAELLRAELKERR